MDGHFSIPNPCSKRWSDLPGDERKRFCSECQTNVHALDQYTPQEFDELRRESQGHVCGYLPGESLPEPRSRRVILVGALLTAISPLMAQSGRVRIRVIDASGAVIPRAEVSLLGVDGNPQRTLQTDDTGEVVFTDLPLGNSRFRVRTPSFGSLHLTVMVRNGEEIFVNPTLADFVGSVMMTGRPKRRWWQIFR